MPVPSILPDCHVTTPPKRFAVVLLTLQHLITILFATINPSLPTLYIPAPTTSRVAPPTSSSPFHPLYFLLFLFLLAQGPHPATYAV